MRYCWTFFLFLNTQASQPPTQNDAPSLVKIIIASMGKTIVKKAPHTAESFFKNKKKFTNLWEDFNTELKSKLGTVYENVESPLKIACAEQIAQQLEVKISSIDYEKVDERKHSLLHLAAQKNNTWFVQLLLQMQLVSIDQQNIFGNTALHVAIIQKSEASVVELIKNGANLYRKNRNLESPIICAANHGSIKMLDFLLAQNPIQLKECDKNGNNLLHHATFAHNMPVVAHLARRLDVNAKNHDGQIPLHIAAMIHHKKLAQTLLQLGARKTVGDHEGNLPYSYTSDNSLQQLLKPNSIIQKWLVFKSYLSYLG